MSTPLIRSLEERIAELQHSIQSQQEQLTHYQSVLAAERAKGPASKSPARAVPGSHNGQRETGIHASALKVEQPVYRGNQSAFVLDVLRECGAHGATPGELAEVFDKQQISYRRQGIYNALDKHLRAKRVVRREGRYFVKGVGTAPAVSEIAPVSGKKGKVPVAPQKKAPGHSVLASKTVRKSAPSKTAGRQAALKRSTEKKAVSKTAGKKAAVPKKRAASSAAPKAL